MASKWKQEFQRRHLHADCSYRKEHLSLSISAGLNDEWCLQCVLASSLFPNLLHSMDLKSLLTPLNYNLIQERGKGHLYWSVKLPDQRLRSRRWAEAVRSWNWKEYISLSWQFFKYLGFFFHISAMWNKYLCKVHWILHIESTKGLYLCSFVCAKVTVSDVKWRRRLLPCVSWKIPAEIWIPNVIRRLREHGTSSTVRTPGLVWQNITTSTKSFYLKVAPVYSRTLR